MDSKLKKTNQAIAGNLQITGSKSESNRLLILKSLFPNIQIKNLSNSDDTKVLQQALNSSKEIIDVSHAGTAMRFLTAYFAIQKGKTVLLTGSKRMQKRPIKILIEALKSLGADIQYQYDYGYPPLIIHGKTLQKNEVSLAANVSSQYISALILIAPVLPNGLTIHLKEKITSAPYIFMTLSLLKQLGIRTDFKENKIHIQAHSFREKVNFQVESDWSSASYFYSLVALSSSANIQLSTYNKNSIQGDAVLYKLYSSLGVRTTFSGNTIQLQKKTETKLPQTYKADLVSSPDLAQTIAVTCLGLGIGCELKGLHTLKIKETDRLVALKTELEKLGAKVCITNHSLTFYPTQELCNNQEINTYNDHRMAMAFAPLSQKTNLTIKNAEVVSKSFPDFWKAFHALTQTPFIY